MHTTHLLLLALPPLTLAQTLPSPLLPWQLTTLTTSSPSNRPGNSPYSSLFLSITDPNTIPFTAPPSYHGPAISLPPISANCSVRWNALAEQPFGRVTPCADVAPGSGRWTVEMGPGNATASASATGDFRVRVVLERSVVLHDGRGVVSLVFEGEGGFSVGGELRMVCGASGVCSSGLKEGTGPVLVRQVLRERRCVYGVCE
ncbi:hypothetical protein QBC39DRAFT_308734 [Podospora conica]|nr:hypothetical protein QBC39DRAFT_308734 [Schizothecium conicum]